MATLDEEAIELHERLMGKIEVRSRVALKSRKDLALAYTPGMGVIASAVASNKKLVYRYTIKHNAVAVVSDGSAVLGLGDIGPEAAIPVMEGKCVLFRELGGINAFPICLDVHSPDEIVAAVKAIAPVFGGINLEDIAAPKCFEIEARLKRELSIPVMHDDQHATAVVVLAGVLNALKVLGKRIEDVSVVINGAGAAGIATARMLHKAKVKDIIMVDTAGAIYAGRKEGMNPVKEEMSGVTNRSKRKGGLGDVVSGADIFIGVSKAGVLTSEMVKSMASRPVIFAMANPIPEIMPDDARAGGAAIVATGRADFPNQINNSLAFPGIFRGALDCRAREINEEMKLAAAHALAALVPSPSADRIVPDPLDPSIVPAISKAVASAALLSGVAGKEA